MRRRRDDEDPRVSAAQRQANHQTIRELEELEERLQGLRQEQQELIVKELGLDAGEKKKESVV